MSLKQHTYAILADFGAPKFPDTVNGLNKCYSRTHWKGTLLEDAGQNILGYAKRGRSTTFDGYVWFWGLTFCNPAIPVTVCVLFPWGLDWEESDNSPQDRSIAVYARWDVVTFESGIYERITSWLVNRYTDYVCKRLLKCMERLQPHNGAHCRCWSCNSQTG